MKMESMIGKNEQEDKIVKIKQIIDDNEALVFVKFGDGEYNAMIGTNGSNCDNDPYENKRHRLRESIEYFSHLDNAYVGKWCTDEVSNYLDSIVTGHINWMNYHVFIMDEGSFSTNLKLELYRAIKDCKRKKILVANELMVKARYLLNVDEHIVVPYQNWVQEFDHFRNLIENLVVNGKEIMILFCAGMGSKFMIMELHKKFPHGIYIDLGSALDFLCTRKCSRGYTYTYDILEEYFQPLLPINWNDPKFDPIYEMAKIKIGFHLSK